MASSQRLIDVVALETYCHSRPADNSVEVLWSFMILGANDDTDMRVSPRWHFLRSSPLVFGYCNGDS
jgi:hypothetical protein